MYLAIVRARVGVQELDAQHKVLHLHGGPLPLVGLQGPLRAAHQEAMQQGKVLRLQRPRPVPTRHHCGCCDAMCSSALRTTTEALPGDLPGAVSVRGATTHALP